LYLIYPPTNDLLPRTYRVGGSAVIVQLLQTGNDASGACCVVPAGAVRKYCADLGIETIQRSGGLLDLLLQPAVREVRV
jgi:hypothetical protein